MPDPAVTNRPEPSTLAVPLITLQITPRATGVPSASRGWARYAFSTPALARDGPTMATDVTGGDGGDGGGGGGGGGGGVGRGGGGGDRGAGGGGGAIGAGTVTVTLAAEVSLPLRLYATTCAVPGTVAV